MPETTTNTKLGFILVKNLEKIAKNSFFDLKNDPKPSFWEGKNRFFGNLLRFLTKMKPNLVFVTVSDNFFQILSHFGRYRKFLTIFCPGWVTSPPYGQYNVQLSDQQGPSGGGMAASTARASSSFLNGPCCFGISRYVFTAGVIALGVIILGIALPLSLGGSSGASSSDTGYTSSGGSGTIGPVILPRCGELDDLPRTCDKPCKDGYKKAPKNEMLCFPICPSFQHNTDEGVCVENICTCQYGTPVLPENCDIHQREYCSKSEPCNKGYTLNVEGICAIDRCNCKNGIGLSPCPGNNVESCAACNTNFIEDRSLGVMRCVLDPAFCRAQNKIVLNDRCEFTGCQCPNGTPLSPCPLGGQECSECNSGYKLSADKKSCEPECVCTGGVLSYTQTCTVSGAENCGDECDKYFHKHPTDPRRCVPNVCTCDGGTPKIQCEIHGQEDCQSCGLRSQRQLHLTLDSDEKYSYCSSSKCRCDHGILDEIYCLRDGTQSCGTCDPYYHIRREDHTCVQNECKCENDRGEVVGQSVPAGQCIAHRQKGCVPNSCLPGYKFEDGECLPEECQCDNGIAKAPGLCLSPTIQDCAICNEFYHEVKLQSTVNNISRLTNTCKPNLCSCENGDAKVRGTCQAHNTASCARCNRGYRLINERCVLNECTDCVNGENVDPGDCRIHGQPFCQSCDVNYGLVTDENSADYELCINECMCPNGQGVQGSMCPDPPIHNCQSCDAGFTRKQALPLSTYMCEENICTCDINGVSVGTRKQGGECTVTGKFDCSSCIAGYHQESITEMIGNQNVVFQQCKQNQCTCISGTRVDDIDCTTHDTSKCKACNNFYRPDTGVFPSNACLKNECICVNGVAAFNCRNHGDQQCDACNLGYSLDTVSSTCTANICRCTNGTPIQSPNCPERDGYYCQSCDPFYHVSARQTCTQNLCSCANGDAVASSQCEDHLADQCDPNGCYTGYHYDLATKTCTLNECTCNNGQPLTGADCTVHGKEDCRNNSCDPGYTQDTFRGARTCKKNKCTCNEGAHQDGPFQWETGDTFPWLEGGTPQICAKNNAIFCLRCNNFNHLNEITADEQTCQQNECRCIIEVNGKIEDIGVATSPGSCPYDHHYEATVPKYSDPSNHCSSCHDEFSSFDNKRWFLEDDDNCCDGVTKQCNSCNIDIHIDDVSKCLRKYRPVADMQTILNFTPYDNINDCSDPENCLYRETSAAIVDNNPSLSQQGHIKYRFKLLESAQQIRPTEYPNIIFNTFLASPTLNQLNNLEIATDIESKLGDYALYKLENLVVFYASTWGNEKISEFFFKYSPRLEIIRLGKSHSFEPTNAQQSQYSKVDIIDDHALDENVELTHLEMPGNKLRVITANVFNTNTKLKRLDLRYNYIEQIAQNAFANNLALKEILLSHNKLFEIDPSYFTGLLLEKLMIYQVAGTITADTTAERLRCSVQLGEGARAQAATTTCSLVPPTQRSNEPNEL